MKEIDELVPLTEADIKTLEGKIQTSDKGCAAYLFVVFLITALLAWWLLNIIFLLAIVLGIISVLSLIIAIGAYLPGSAEKNEKLSLDVKEGKKRRIVAPIEMKDLIDVTNNKIAFSMGQQVRNSYKELKFKYYMTVKGYKFNLTEEQYLAGARKGDFVEFYVAPNSGVILSEPIEVRE